MRSLFREKVEKPQRFEQLDPASTPNSASQEISEDCSSSSGLSSIGVKTSARPHGLDQVSPPNLSVLQVPRFQSQPASASLDIVDRGVISFDQASTLFETYLTELVPHFPAVVFDGTVTANEIRKTKPTLFLAIIAAAAGTSDPSLYSFLNSEVLSSYARHVVIEGQRSLELVQAMIVTSVWYYPPGKFAQLKLYPYINMAATMAMDLGLGLKPKSFNRRRNSPGQYSKQSPMPDQSCSDGSNEIERRRTFLACYLITTG
jgi:hypothetical protein